MSLERAQELAKVTIDFANGTVSGVNAQHLTGIKEDGRWVAGSGAYVDTPVPMDGDEGGALASLLGAVNVGLVARVAELEAHVVALEAQLAEE